MYFIKPLMIAMILVFMAPMIADAGLSPDIQKDKYLMELAEYLKHEQYQQALPLFDKLRTLKKEHKVKLPVSLIYFEGEALYYTGQYIKADAKISSYVDRTGKKGKYYSKSLALMIKLDDLKAEQLRKEKAAAEKKEKERQRQLALQAEQQKLTAITADFKKRQQEELSKLPAGTVADGFLLIPGGSFQMGSNDLIDPEREASKRSKNKQLETLNIALYKSYYKSVKPAHEVNIKAFAMGKYEVTFAQYDEFCKVKKWTCDLPKDSLGFGRGDRPVINVSRKDAKAYAKWLSKKLKKKFRLPSEAEWEYAARAGTTSNWSWGDNEESATRYAWFQSNAGNQTHPVGQKSPNAYGLYDMHGNVIEYTQDCWHSNYNGAPSDGKAWKSGNCKFHVYRGGSWYSSPLNMLSAYRFIAVGYVGDFFTGFRLVQELPKVKKKK